MKFPRIKLTEHLTRSEQESLNLFKNLTSSKDVANFLEVPHGQLLYLLYSNNSSYKTKFIQKKNGGQRELAIPSWSIKVLQNKIKPFIEGAYRIKKPAHGFIKGKSILTNAKAHLKAKLILNIDLEDFYGSITFARVRGLLMSSSFNMGPDAATMVSQLLTYNKKLPQGASTSPVISNLISSKLDKELIQLAKKYHLNYTRYADDITLSTTKNELHKNIATFVTNPITERPNLSEELVAIINRNGFRVNQDKTRIQIKSVRQEVTGLTINEFPNVKRKFVRQIRSMIHSYKNLGAIEAEKLHFGKYNTKFTPKKFTGKVFANVIIGKLAFLKMIRGKNDAILSNLANKLDETDIELPKFLKEVLQMINEFDIFIGHASEDKIEIAEPIYKELTSKGLKAFIDSEEIKWGESLTAKINHALASSKFFLAILSENSIEKNWPLKEINSALAREINGKQVFLPLIVGNSEVVLNKLPLLHDKLYLKWNGNANEVYEKFKDINTLK